MPWSAGVCCIILWGREFAKKSESRGSRHQLVNDVFHLLTSDVAVIHFHYTAGSIGTHQTDCKTGDGEQRKLGNTHTHPNTHTPVGQVEGVILAEFLFSLVLREILGQIISWTSWCGKQSTSCSSTNNTLVPPRKAFKPHIAPAELLGGQQQQTVAALSKRLQEFESRRWKEQLQSPSSGTVFLIETSMSV